MRKTNVCIMVLYMLLIFMLTGCTRESKEQVVPAESSKVISQKMIAGEFTATVRDLVPNYVLDDVTPLCAVVTDFQDSPFTISLNEELIAQIEPGKAYVFEIKEQLIEPIYKSNGDLVALTPEVAVAIYNIQVNAVRVPSESEMGLESNRLYIK